jgi:hypothetical protein
MNGTRKILLASSRGFLQLSPHFTWKHLETLQKTCVGTRNASCFHFVLRKCTRMFTRTFCSTWKYSKHVEIGSVSCVQDFSELL